MPVCSYIVHVKENKLPDVSIELETKDECTVYPAQNKEMLILVTETSDDNSEDKLKEKLNEITDIECMALTFANFEGEQ
jgi:nitrate reductase NapAB chaperone NapD